MAERPGPKRDEPKSPRRGAARRASLTILAVLALLAVLVCAAFGLALSSATGRSFLVNTALGLAGIKASVQRADFGASPPRIELSGIAASAALPAASVSSGNPGGTLNFRIASLSLTRNNPADNGLAPAWHLELTSPEMDADLAARPGQPGSAPANTNAPLSALPENLSVTVRGGTLRAAWPDGLATATDVSFTLEPGGAVSLDAQVQTRLAAPIPDLRSLVVGVCARGASPENTHSAGSASATPTPAHSDDGSSVSAGPAQETGSTSASGALARGDDGSSDFSMSDRNSAEPTTAQHPDHDDPSGPTPLPNTPVTFETGLTVTAQVDIPASSARISFQLDRAQVSAAGLDASLEAGGEAVLSRQGATLERLALRLGRMRFLESGPPLPEALTALVTELEANAALRASMSEHGAVVDVDSLVLPGLGLARGRFERTQAGDITMNAEGELEDTARLLPALRPLLPDKIRDFEAGGRMAVSFNLTLPTDGPFRLRAALALPSLALWSPSLGVRANLSGEAGFDDGTLSGRLYMRGDVHRDDVTLPGCILETELSGRAPSIRLERLSFLSAPGGRTGNMALPGVRGSGGAGFMVTGAGVSGAASLETEIQDVGTLACRMRFTPGDRPVTIESAHAALKLDRLAAALGFSARTKGGKPPKSAAGSAGSDLAMAGTVEVHLAHEGAAPGVPIALDAFLKDVRIDLPGRPGVLTRLIGKAGIRLEPGAPSSLSATLTVHGGALHLPTSAVDFSKHPLRMALRLAPRLTAKQAAQLAGRSAANVLGQSVTMEGTAALASLAEVSAKGLLTPSGKGWTGQGSAAIALRDMEGLAGTLAPSMAEHGIALKGKAAMRLAFAGNLQAPKLTGQGEVQLENLRAPRLEASSLRIPVILSKDSLRFFDEATPQLTFTVLGGKLALIRPEVLHPLEPTFEARLSARLSELPMAGLTGGKITSTASGAWDAITLNRDMLAVDGELTAKAFGGDLVIKGLKVAKPFDEDRQFRVHAGLLGADMLALSAMAGVGRITGRLNATLSELHMRGFLPMAFTLRLESIPTPGVEQRISLGAVNSLTEVSTGKPVDLGLATRTALKLFGDFGYTKLGLLIGLKGTMCTVRGLYHEKGVEYILKRSTLTGVDVINGNPENAMPFADLLVRFKKIMNKETNLQMKMELLHRHADPRPAHEEGKAGHY